MLKRYAGSKVITIFFWFPVNIGSGGRPHVLDVLEASSRTG